MKRWTIIEWLVLVAIVAILSAIVYTIWLETVHPCLRYGEHQECWQPDRWESYDGGKTLTWVPGYYYDCTECLERKP